MTMQEFSVNLERLDKLSDEEIELRPGDTIFIDHVAWISIRDAFNVVTTAACPSKSRLVGTSTGGDYERRCADLVGQ